MNKYVKNIDELRELSAITSERLNLNQPYVIEKDLYVTQAIEAINNIQDNYFRLVFQGGTCLAKAHRIIKRMSEDCDFRMEAKFESKKLGKEGKRRALRKFRHHIIEQLKQADFVIEDSAIRTRNEGQFMSVRMQYPSVFPVATDMKHYLAFEYFLAEVKTPTVIKPVTTLIQRVLGEKVSHPNFSVNSISVIETAAEKWVALTRRVATMTHRAHYRNASLVRHLYDLYNIEKKGLFTDDKFEALISRIVQDDRQQYKNHNDDYYQDPAREIKRAIEVLNKDPEWKSHWQNFINTMVYDDTKPSYEAAIQNFNNKSTIALQAIAQT